MNLNAASARRIAFTQREPIGVVVAVSAFNHPLNLIVHQVGPGARRRLPGHRQAGRRHAAVVLALRRDPARGRAARRDWCQALRDRDQRRGDAAGHATARVGFFSFIGSAAVGWMLRSKLAPGARCALEHGGAAPVIVAADADLDAALPKLAKGGFYHAGQVCVSVQRIFAHRSIAEQLAERIAERWRERSWSATRPRPTPRSGR